MFKLIKWAVIGAGAAAGVGFLLFGTDVGSYVGTAASSIRAKIQDEIPVEFQLERAGNLIQKIEPQLQDAKRQYAQAVVDLKKAHNDVDRIEGEITHDEQKLRAVSASLVGEGSTRVQLAGFQRARAEFDLERTFDAYKSNLALLKAKEALIERQAKAVNAAQAHLDAVCEEKVRLEEMVARLKTQKKQLDAIAASSQKFELDDSALGEARALLHEIENRLDVAQEMLEHDMFFEGDAPTTGNRDIAREVHEYLSQSEGCADVEEDDLVEIRR